MDVSLAALIRQLLNMRAFSSTGTQLESRITAGLNTALDRMAGEAPEVLVPTVEHVELLADATSTDASGSVPARLKVSPTDRRVLLFTNTTGGVLDSATWAPTVDGTWDGLMHLEITDPTGRVRRRQSMEWWAESDAPPDYRVTIDHPWPNATDELMSFRIHQPAVFLDADVTRLAPPCRIFDEMGDLIGTLSEGSAARLGFDDNLGQTTGRPEVLYPGEHVQLPTPQGAPTATFSATAWAGPEFNGSFRFRYTFARGRRGNEHQESPEGVIDPVWESAPSPEVSYTPTVTGVITTINNAIDLRADNIDAMLGYDVTGSAREKRSGYYIIWYVARDSILTASPGYLDRVEAAGKWYRLATVNAADTSPTATYTWNGSVQPDLMRPLRWSTGYRAWHPYPHQDQRYDVDLRTRRLPKRLEAAQDVPPLHRDAIPALLELALYYICLLDGADQGDAAIHEGRYRILMRKVRANHGNPAGVVTPASLTPNGRRLSYGRYSSS